jgi:serine/threonine protein kinase/tetratricopeptide (TPR) repeat protein
MAIEAISGYELLEVLGDGPRGTVYKARDGKSGRWVTVKVLHAIEPEGAGNLLALNHAHIATLFDIGSVGSQRFVVSEYLPGGTLKDHIRSLESVGDFLPFEQILAYAGQIADALVYAQRQGILHGNLKSENVMFGEDGILKLTDFSGRSASSLEVTPIVDLAAFGTLLYEMATGKVLFPGSTILPFDRFRKDLPATFTQMVSRILDRDRPDRYLDLLSILADLSPVSSSETVTCVTVPVSSDSPVLSGGKLLAGRFRIVRFIARGGMGEVYEAEDLELSERVALKTVRSEIAGDGRAMERFKREIHLARKVTHPNVCRIFDLFHDVAGPERITFLTMELLDGETLHQKLQHTGRMSTTEALPIIRQMAAGLAAAHRAGVIHRDFKTSNVMLVPTNGPEFRAVVTDFGLARSTLSRDTMATLSTAGDLAGTPAYMAPEQLEDGEITAATDVYALGIVMYEAVTGRLPFTGDAPLAVALKRLQGPPPSPRNSVPALDDIWETTILRCLERRPADRFAQVEDVVEALTGETATTSRTAAVTKGIERTTGRRRFAWIAAVVLVLGLLVGTLAIRGKRTARSDIKSRPAIAVLGFRNLTGNADSAWLSTALAEMLTTELAAGEKLRAIPGENVARMKLELSLPESSSFAADTLGRIRSYLGADIVIYGSYVVLDGTPTKVRMDLRLQDSSQGDLLATISEEGYSTDLLELVSRSGAELRDRLGVGKLRPQEADVAHAAFPATPAAARFYAEGLEKLRVFDAAGARAALEKAVAEDERYALAHAALATSWSMLGYATQAREQSKIALDLSTKLPREDQLLIEGRAREAALEWRQAVDVYRTLFGFFPDNLDYGLRLAAAQTSAGDGNAALATIDTLRKFPEPDGDSPRIDLAEARAAGALSDFKRQQTMAARAAAKAKQDGAKLLVAGAGLLEGSALANMGELSRARAALEGARQMYSAAGDRWDSVNASTNLAYVLLQSGDIAGAEEIYRQSLATYRELGDQKGTAAALGSIATIFRNRGDLSRAKAMHEQALAIHREIGDRVGEATSCNNLANILSLIGDHDAARRMYETALPLFREIGDKNGLATVLSNLGDLVSEEGDLARARELYEESRATFQNLGNKSSLAYELSRLGELDLINGDLAAAHKNHEQALALRKQSGEKRSVGDSELALGQIALQAGDPSTAEAMAKAASEEFRAANRPDDEASAMAVLARSFLVRGKNAESGQAIRRAEELSTKSNDRSVRLSVGITSASIRAASGDTARAIKDLEAISAEARDAALVQLELEARLAVAEIEIAEGRLQTARLHLEALERDASSRGYKYLASRASAARRKAMTAA